MSLASTLINQENTMAMPKTIIFGMGDQSRYCEEILMMNGHKNIVKALWPTELEITDEDEGIVAIGDNWGRSKVVNAIIAAHPNFRFINAIHPSCIVSDEHLFGLGILAMAGVIFNCGCIVKGHTFIATGAQIEHDCIIEDFASVSAGSVLGGHVTIGKHSAITLGCTVFDRVMIGANTVIGSGSLVTKDIGENRLAYGSPAKVVRWRKEGEKFLK